MSQLYLPHETEDLVRTLDGIQLTQAEKDWERSFTEDLMGTAPRADLHPALRARVTVVDAKAQQLALNDAWDRCNVLDPQSCILTPRSYHKYDRTDSSDYYFRQIVNAIDVDQSRWLRGWNLVTLDHVRFDEKTQTDHWTIGGDFGPTKKERVVAMLDDDEKESLARFLDGSEIPDHEQVAEADEKDRKDVVDLIHAAPLTLLRFHRRTDRFPRLEIVYHWPNLGPTEPMPEGWKSGDTPPPQGKRTDFSDMPEFEDNPYWTSQVQRQQEQNERITRSITRRSSDAGSNAAYDAKDDAKAVLSGTMMVHPLSLAISTPEWNITEIQRQRYQRQLDDLLWSNMESLGRAAAKELVDGQMRDLLHKTTDDSAGLPFRYPPRRRCLMRRSVVWLVPGFGYGPYACPQWALLPKVGDLFLSGIQMRLMDHRMDQFSISQIIEEIGPVRAMFCLMRLEPQMCAVVDAAVNSVYDHSARREAVLIEWYSVALRALEDDISSLLGYWIERGLMNRKQMIQSFMLLRSVLSKEINQAHEFIQSMMH